MHGAEGWFICRIGFIETLRAVTIAGGDAAGRAFRREWPAFGVVEVDERLTEHGAKLSLEHGLGSSDALHLAAALVLPATQLAFATWDGRLRTGALAEGLAVLPAAPQA
jgi:predicted nucleic acid-binding protein